jgi:hypothetical protein
MNLETRLARCIAYRDEAMLDPINNRLYIEDLTLSIKMFEKAVKKPEVRKGWEDD